MFMKIGELSRKTGCKIVTIRYYEKLNLINADSRTSSNYRVYTRKEQRKLEFILNCRKHGLSICKIKQLLDYIKDNTENCDVVDKLIANHLKNIDKQIASLNKLKLDLQKVVSSCGSKKSLSQCKVLKHLSDCVEFK